jgi:hypothetical protein
VWAPLTPLASICAAHAARNRQAHLVERPESEELAIQIKSIRAAMVARIELISWPELSMLPEAERSRLIVAMGILMDFESWGSCATSRRHNATKF